jgi:hypothetical protein
LGTSCNIHIATYESSNFDLEQTEQVILDMLESWKACGAIPLTLNDIPYFKISEGEPGPEFGDPPMSVLKCGFELVEGIPESG